MYSATKMEVDWNAFTTEPRDPRLLPLQNEEEVLSHVWSAQVSIAVTDKPIKETHGSLKHGGLGEYQEMKRTEEQLKLHKTGKQTKCSDERKFNLNTHLSINVFQIREVCYKKQLWLVQLVGEIIWYHTASDALEGESRNSLLLRG